MDKYVKAIVALAGVGAFALLASIGNKALEGYVEDAVAQEAERQDVARAREVKELRVSQEAATSRLEGIEGLLRRQDDRAEREYCLSFAYPDSTAPARERTCDLESEARWRAWAKQDSIAKANLEEPE